MCDEVKKIEEEASIEAIEDLLYDLRGMLTFRQIYPCTTFDTCISAYENILKKRGVSERSSQ